MNQYMRTPEEEDYARKQRVTAGGIVQDYKYRNIAPDKSHNVKGGLLNVWIWCNQYICELVIGDIMLTVDHSYCNTHTPQDIADDIYKQIGGDITIAEVQNV